MSPQNEQDHDLYQPGSLKMDLEKMYIEEYLQSRGYRWADLCNLPAEETKRLMCEASTYASNKLAEVESRAHFTDVIHFPDHS